MAGDVLVRGGTVVDGTGGSSRRADVRVRDGLIVEVEPGLVPDGEREVDASGAFVIPGIIDSHTHVDGAMWWNPDLDPLPAYGNTSAVFGNCGNSIAPLVAGPQRDEIVDLLCFLEDLPREPFEKTVPWTWEGWPEYHAALQGCPTTVHVGGYLGHLSLRTYVMGAAAWEREATDDEIARMAAILDEGLANGALGLSANHFDKDRQLRPVPGYFASDTEYGALLDVLARHPGRTFQVITRFNDDDHYLADGERFARLCRERGVRAQWPGIPTDVLERHRREPTWDLHRRANVEGDFWSVIVFKPLEPYFGFERSIVFQRVPAWNEMINGPAEAKLATLADPAWRARARHEWDNRPHVATARVDRPHSLVFASSESGAGPLGISLADYAAQNGWHVSDALAEWLLRNGISSFLVGTPDELDEDAVVAGLRDSRTLTNINDSGAHQQLFCGAGQNVYLFTHYVRDRGLLSIEEAVHVLTGRAAEFFGLRDRGVVAPGRVGDLAVFALDEIELAKEMRVHDVPFGGWRFTRPPAGFRATIAAGTPTWLDGAATGTRPGTVLR